MFTLNNYTEADEERLKALQCRYLVYGREVGEEGTAHLQGYVYFRNDTSWKWLNEKLLKRAWIDKKKGTHEQAIAYCKKDGDFFEEGEAPVSKKRKGEMGAEAYEEAFRLAKEGRIEEIQEPLRTRFYSTYKKIQADNPIKYEPLSELDNYWYWGATGTGKSRKARTDHPDAFIKNCNKWWDGYRDEDVVIIEEWAPCHEVLASHLKTWADYYPINGEVKGGGRMLRPKKLIITSNYHPRACFTRESDLEPILRRFKVVEFKHLVNAQE